MIDAFVRQTSIQSMAAYMYDLHESLPEGVIAEYYMEGNFLQDIILQAFTDEGEQRKYQLPVKADRRKKPDKFSRIEATAAYYERGMIFYNREKMDDPDFAVAIEQLLAIEPGSKAPDDSPDADEGALYILNNKPAKILNAVIGEREPGHNW